MATLGLIDNSIEPELFVSQALTTGSEIVKDVTFEVVRGFALLTDHGVFEAVNCPLKGKQLLGKGYIHGAMR